MKGGDGIVPVPADRWDSNAYYDPDKSRKGKMYVRRGGFLEKIDQFDPLFFGMSPAEATRVDPQHRWLLELTYEALENAGLKAGELKGSDTAVYIGQFMHDYEQLQLDSMAKGLLNSHSATGPSMTLTANRISYVFDFKGPSVTLDTACSSSLVALDLACKAILTGDSHIAIAGGVNILLRPELTMSICKASMLSPEGQCKSFDAAANGYVRSEGAGVILVKRLSEAQRDKNPILAVIKATGVNQDGQTVGITVPSGDAQKALLQRTLRRAEIAGEDIQYAEAHGTGTAVGDPIEVNALGSLLGRRGGNIAPCIIGSVKSNIGHAESAAGVAGLIKTVQAMINGIIPPNIHYHTTNPAINLGDLNLRIADQTIVWPDRKDKPRRAVVNSFGFGGTNANVVLEQAPPTEEGGFEQTPAVTSAVKLLPISAKTEEGRKAQAAKYLEYFKKRRGSQDIALNRASLHDICYTASTKREHHRYRLVANGSTEEELQRALEAFIKDEASTSYVRGTASNGGGGKICFVFSGMGTQWAGMGRQLYRTEPVFKEAMDRCSTALSPLTGWSLIDLIYNESFATKVDETCIAQPGIFSVQVALAALLKSWGIEPDCVVGHSAGEVGAAYIAGALSFDDAIRVIYHRSRLQQTTEGMGKMLAVGLSESALQPYLEGWETKVSIGAINSDDTITLAGDETALTAIAAKLDDKGIFARFLKVGVPYHSPVMNQLKEPLIESLQGIVVREPHTLLYSTVSGAVTQPDDWSPPYWADNIRKPVLFKAAVDAIARKGIRVFLEVAPHPALGTSIDKNLAKSKTAGVIAATLKRGQDDTAMLAGTLGTLHTSGWTLDWAKLYPNGGRCVVLPNYAWQHASYWCEAEDVQRSRLKNVTNRSGLAEAVHPLVGSRLISPEPIWQKMVDLQDQAFLADHQVENEVIFPAAGYIEVALGIAQREYRHQQVVLENVEFKRALFLDSKKPTLMETKAGSNGACLTISALSPQTGEWSVYSEATIAEANLARPYSRLVLSELLTERHSLLTKSDFYQHCHKLGLTYQPSFQAVEKVWFTENEAIVELALPDSLISANADYVLHPVLLDGAFQGVFPLLTRGYLPVEIAVLNYHTKPAERSYCRLTLISQTVSEIVGDLTLFDQDGTVTVQLFGIRLKSANTRDTARNQIDSKLYSFNWQPQPYPADDTARVNRQTGKWIILADKGGKGRKLADELEQRGHSVVVINQDSRQSSSQEWMKDTPGNHLINLLRSCAEECSGIIYLWGLENHPGRELSARLVINNCHNTSVLPMQIVQSIDKIEWHNPPHIYFVSQSAHHLAADDGLPQPSQGALWGFGRVFSTEFPNYKFSLIDLAERVDDALISRLAEEVLSESSEQEIALRESARYINRIRPLGETLLHDFAEQSRIPGENGPFKLVQRFKTTDANRFAIVSCTLPELKPTELELKVDCCAINKADLEQMAQTSKSTEDEFTRESIQAYGCVGQIIEMGRDVYGFNPGDRVIAFGRPGLASIVHAAVKSVVKKPSHLSIEEAAALPAAFLPAHYALNYLAQLKEGEHVLIHDAADTLGLAAIQFAQLKRARIYATASTPEKREALAALGVDSIFDSTTREFADSVMSATDYRGVDIVLNVLSGQTLSKTLGVLKPFGRLIDFAGTADASSSFVLKRIVSKNISYHAVSLAELEAQRSELCGELLNELASLFEARLLRPIAPKLVACDRVDKAWAAWQSEGRLQTYGITFDQPDILVGSGVSSTIINGESTYLISGGLGGLGLEIMKWLADGGAKSIVVMGRNAPSENAWRAIEAVRARGVTVCAQKADVAVPEDVLRVLNSIEKEMLPLAGVIHAAGVLDDGVITQQTEEKFQRVLGPKVKGAWNLHQLTGHISLDFFVCFSSIAPIIGWAGQSNYAAANGFIDTLAHLRQALGKPALSINWGPWSDSGMAASLEARDIQRMKDSGMTALPTTVALEAMGRLLKFRVPQACVVDLDWAMLLSRDPDPSRKTLFKDLVATASSGTNTSFIDQLRAAPRELREGMLAEKVSAMLAEVLGITSAGSIDRSKSVVDYGVNSLMAMDLRNRLQGLVKAKLPATLVLKYPTVNAMVGCILDQETMAAAEESEKLYWDPKDPDVVINHEINGPLATLTPSVQNWIFEGHTAHFNVGTLLEIDGSNFNLKALKTALHVAFTYHDGCRLQLFSESGQLKQEIVPLGREGVEIHEHDFRALSYEEGAAKMEELNDRLQRSFSFVRGNALYRAAYYQLNDKTPHRFFLIFHHYVSDAMSQKIIWQTITNVYQKVLDRVPVTLPAKGATLIDWTQKLHEFAYGEAVKQLPYWTEKIEKSRACFIADDFKSYRARQLDDYVIHWAAVEREDYARLVDFCRKNQYEVSDVGTYALVKAFSRLTRSESLWVDLITHARSGIVNDFEIPEIFGQISESASILFELLPKAGHKDQILAVRKQRLDVPNGGIGLRALRFINQSPSVREKLAEDESPQIGLNFDVTDYESEAGKSWVRFAREKSGAFQGLHLRKTADQLRLAFFVDIKARGGRLTMAIGYYKDRFYPDSISAVAETFVSILKNVVASEEVQNSDSPRLATVETHLAGASRNQSLKPIERE